MTDSGTVLLAADSYAPIAVLVVTAAALGAAIIILTHVIPKPHRHGPLKDATYEAGMEPIGDARQRFNVRFYLVAMLFLLFDVELVFMYPWALMVTGASKGGAGGATRGPEAVGSPQFLFFEMVIFFAILLVGYVYAWRKGVFRWE